jgi:hypothetical protein
MRTAKLVNKGLVGEPEHICFQDIESNEIIEFSRVTNEEIADGDYNHWTIQLILQRGHMVEYTLEDDSKITLHYEEME